MLASLSVRDIVLIAKAELSFAPGLNVLTGETGAGKSILLDALGLAAGARRAGRASVRPSAETGSAIAVFQLGSGHPLLARLREEGMEAEDEVILRRAVSGDGRTRAFINDTPVSVGRLSELGGALLEVHGQADDRGLFDPVTHRILLDAFGGHAAEVEGAAAAYAAFAASRTRVETIRATQARATEELDFLSHAVRELSDLAAEEGDEEKLAAERALLMNAGRIAEEIGAAADFVTGDEGAENMLAQALRRLSRLTPEGKQAAAPAETALDTALAHIQEGRRELESLLARLELDPAQLDRTEERLFALRAAARKYQVSCDRLPALLKDFEAKLTAVDEGGTGLAAAEAEAARLREAFLKAAQALSAARRTAAKRLEETVARELAPLKLGHARFRVALAPISEGEAGPHGLERVGFEIATVEGAPFGPLARIASGGELARFALALKVALSEASPPAVLVFDEVDRGVGGAVADAVGERLQRLARTTQVLLVTHSPQVAARAQKHFRISRAGDDTRIDELDEAARVEDIARMLAGAAITEEARAAARRLLAEAEEPEQMAKKPAVNKKVRA
jgi:DNA repair protein RecN (Recombination protein N)